MTFGEELAARVRRLEEETGADFWDALAALRRHGGNTDGAELAARKDLPNVLLAKPPSGFGRRTERRFP